MSGSRRRRFGSLRKLPSGRWQVRYPNAAGEQVKAPNTYERKGEAERFLTMIEADLMRGEYRDPALARIALKEWAERWYATTSHLAPQTQIDYRRALDRHILPAFGGEAVGGVDTPALRTFFNNMIANGMPKASVVKIRAVTRMVLAAAVEGGALKSNPAVGIKLGKIPQREKVFLLPQQVLDLAHAIANPPRPKRHAARVFPDLALLIMFAAYTGLRASELAALKISRLDLMRKRVHVVESVSEIPKRGMVFGPTKNSLIREVPIPKFLIDDLTAHIAGKRPDDLVFTSPTGEILRQTNFYKRFFRPAAERAGLPPHTRFHDLRHTFAALSIASDTGAFTLSKWMGHSSIHVTYSVYGHLLPDIEDEAADRLSEMGAYAKAAHDAAAKEATVAQITTVSDGRMARGWHGATASDTGTA